VIEHVQVGNDNGLVPAITTLENNYPNPFNPSTKIEFGLNAASHVLLEIYNIKGEKVKTLINEDMAASYHTAVWNGKDDGGKAVSSGVYFYKMRTDNYQATRKMVLMK